MSWSFKFVGSRLAVIAALSECAKNENSNLPAQIAIQQIQVMSPVDPKNVFGQNGVIAEGYGHVGGSFYLKVDQCELAKEPVIVKESPAVPVDAPVVLEGGDSSAKAVQEETP